jgi:hypothetical protein
VLPGWNVHHRQYVSSGKILLGGGNHHLISGNVLKDSLLNDIWQMKSKPDEYKKTA